MSFASKWRRRGRAGLLAAALAGTVAGGCDDDGASTPSRLTVFVLSPDRGEVLGCADDQDPGTADTLEYDVEVLVGLRGRSHEGLTVRIWQGEARDAAIEQSVSPDGRALFAAFPFAPGDDVVLHADLMRGTDTVASTTTILDVVFDDADPACRRGEPIELTFVAPGAGAVLGASDDADGNLANDLQVDVSVQVQGPATGELVLTVDGAEAARRPAGTTVTFPGVTLPIGDGSGRTVRLGLTAQGPDGPTSAERQVEVRVDGCALSVSPEGGGGACDLRDSDDVDPEAEGLQIDLVAQSNCAEVAFEVNGETTTAEVADGRATARVTLGPGENTVAARATTAGGLVGTVAPYSLTVGRDTGAALDLDPVGATLLDLGDAEGMGGQATWTLTGTSTGLLAGDQVALHFDPALPGAPETAAVGADGTFSFMVSAAYWCGDVGVSAPFSCDDVASASYSLCLDAVQPVLGITAPADGALIDPSADIDPQAAGIQLAVEVAVDDPRPADVDYDLSVQCSTAPPGGFRDRHQAFIRRSDLEDGQGTIFVTIPQGEEGTLVCRAFALPSPNEPVLEEVTWQVAQRLPTFRVLQPAVFDDRVQCYGPEVLVGGQGANLDDFGSSLFALVVPEADPQNDLLLPMSAEGNDRYTLRFGADGVEPLADGAYTVAVSGFIQGGLAVAVDPAGPVPFVVDTTVPVVSLLDPPTDRALGAEDDQNGDLAGDCVQTALTLRLEDATAEEVCYALNGGLPRCAPVGEDGTLRVETVSLLPGANDLVLSAADCAGNRVETALVLTTEGCGARIRIVSPVDGARVGLAADLDPETEDVLDLDVTLETGLAEGEEVVVTVDGVASAPVAVDAEGFAVVRVAVALPAEREAPFGFVLQGRTADGAVRGPEAQVTVLFDVPTIALPAFDACLGLSAPDASLEDGFQIAVVANTARAERGAAASLAARCGDFEAQVAGAVDDQGRVTFPPLTLADEATCTLTATVIDGAGQEGTAVAEVAVDRLPPTIEFLHPPNGSVLNEANDEDQRAVPDAAGLQVTPRIRVCGATDQTLRVDTEPSIRDEGFEVLLADPVGDCSTAALGLVTLPEGGTRFNAQVADACGNTARVTSETTVDLGESLVISRPARGAVVRVRDDLDPQAAGCQLQLEATAVGLPRDTAFTVCTSFDQGAGPAACDGGSQANSGPCVVQGQLGRQVVCPLTLQDGAHSLTLVADGEPLALSEAVNITADCTAPTVRSITVVEDADQNGCLNRRERQNPDALANSRFSIEFEVEGIEDGRLVGVRFLPGEVLIQRVPVMGGRGQVTANLVAGQYSLYLRGDDAAGNTLPLATDPNLPRSDLRIDITPPAPTLVNLVPQVCLNAADDEGAADGLQYRLQVQTGAAVGEMVTVRAALDGQPVHEAPADAAEVLVGPVDVPEGDHGVTVTVTDACGNVGSVGRFAQANGRDDWSQPLPVSFRVDTVPPSLRLSGVGPGQVLTADDDADQNPGNGFQVALSVDLDPAAPLEAGRTVALRSGERALATSPSPVTMPAGAPAALPVTVTLPPGAHALTAVAFDACGNEGRAPEVPVQVQIEGCGSALVGFAGSPAVLGPADGDVIGNALRIDVAAQVDLFDPSCANARAQLLLDGAPLGADVAVGDGNLAFPGVSIPRGTHDLELRVTLDAVQTPSPVQRLVVDLETPRVTFVAPAGAQPVAVQQDADPVTPGQQLTVSVQIDEGQVDSPRTATLTLDGQPVGAPRPVPEGGRVNFSGVTIPPGQHTLRVCARDQASNEACASIDVLADPADPGGFDADVEITDPRLTEVVFTFVAPGDDGDEGGPVQHYELRRLLDQPVTAENWANATVVGTYPATAEPGAVEQLTVAGLPLNLVHRVGLRAVDDVGRMGPVASLEVDLQLNRATFDLQSRDGSWDANDFFTPTSMVQSAGDVDNDGFDDLLVIATRINGESQAAIIFGAEDPTLAEVLPLNVSPNVAQVFFASSGAGVGDVNGDGAADVALLGYLPDFSGAAVTLYLGCPDPGACDRAGIADPVSVISTPGRISNHVAGLGNFNQVAGDAAPYDDFMIGGSAAGGGNRVFIIAGRAAWPAAINATQLDAATGVTALQVPEANAGVFGAGVGDLDGDGRTEIAFSAGGQFNDSYVFYGGDAVPATVVYAAANPRTVKLVHPCPVEGTQSTFGSYFAGGVDLSGDEEGRPDFVVGDRNTKRLVVFDQDLQMVDCFGRVEVRFGVVFDLAGDINGDGGVDIIATHGDDARTTDAFVYYNDADEPGRFGTGEGIENRVSDVRLVNPPRRKLGVARAGDFDGDGRDDLASVVKEPGGPLRVTVYY